MISEYFCLQAVQSMVQQAMEYIDQTPDIETKIELIKTLNNVSAGKVRSSETNAICYLHYILIVLCNCLHLNFACVSDIC